MKRFAHILWNGASMASLVLCLATMALWHRSYAHADELQYDGETITYSANEKLEAETKWFLAPRQGGLWLYYTHAPSHGIWDGPAEGGP